MLHSGHMGKSVDVVYLFESTDQVVQLSGGKYILEIYGLETLDAVG